MKALLISEYNFERGENPKKTLRIGRDEITLKPFRISWEPQNGIPLSDFWIEEAFKDLANFPGSLVFSENNNDEENTHSDFTLDYLRSNKSPYRIIKWKDKLYSIPKDIKEDYNFERGIEPKEALGLGVVTVSGDRGVGRYKVLLLGRYYGNDVMEDEIVHKVKYIQGKFKGLISYAIKNDPSKRNFKKEVWGEIDPFINVDI